MRKVPVTVGWIQVPVETTKVRWRFFPLYAWAVWVVRLISIQCSPCSTPAGKPGNAGAAGGGGGGGSVGTEVAVAVGVSVGVLVGVGVGVSVGVGVGVNVGVGVKVGVAVGVRVIFTTSTCAICIGSLDENARDIVGVPYQANNAITTTDSKRTSGRNDPDKTDLVLVRSEADGFWTMIL